MQYLSYCYYYLNYLLNYFPLRYYLISFAGLTPYGLRLIPINYSSYQLTVTAAEELILAFYFLIFIVPPLKKFVNYYQRYQTNDKLQNYNPSMTQNFYGSGDFISYSHFGWNYYSKSYFSDWMKVSWKLIKQLG